jgi:quercetin dioxygenase-like cupin family protein
MNNLPYTFIADLLAQIQDIPPDSIVSRTFYSDEQLKAIVFGFAAGQELSEHTASQPAVLHFLKGEAELTLGMEQMAVQAGAWVHMQPQLPHSIVAKTPVVMLLLLFKTGPIVAKP